MNVTQIQTVEIHKSNRILQWNSIWNEWKSAIIFPIYAYNRNVNSIEIDFNIEWNIIGMFAMKMIWIGRVLCPNFINKNFIVIESKFSMLRADKLILFFLSNIELYFCWAKIMWRNFIACNERFSFAIVLNNINLTSLFFSKF